MGWQVIYSKRYTHILIILAAVATGGCAHKDLTTERLEAYRSYQTGDYIQAAEKFENLVEDIPKDAELWFRLGNSYAKAKRPQKAIVAYENALLRNPEMAKAWFNKGIICLQAALKSFVDMQAYTEPDDPVAIQGRLIRDSLFDILEGSGANEKNVE